MSAMFAPMTPTKPTEHQVSSRKAREKPESNEFHVVLSAAGVAALRQLQEARYYGTVSETIDRVLISAAFGPD